jgi:hypothetical protein
MHKFIRSSILASTLLFALTSCGGGGSGSGEESNINIKQGFGPNDTSSHALQTAAIYVNRQAIRITNPGTFVHAVSYADFDLDGDVDVFMSSGDGSMNPTPSELYLNDGAGNFTLDTSFFNGSPPGQIHPRKALTGDYNGDGKMDIFVIGHGYDQPPFPGEAPYVILSSPSGYVMGSGLDSFIGFQHGGSSADIDNDNDIDVFVTDTNQPFFLVNDGFGNFTRDVTKTPDLGGGGIYTAELVDVDKDGFIDLLVSGHEYQGFSSQVLWGDNTGIWSVTRSTTLPQIAGRGVVIDIDVADIDMDGHKDIFLTRTGDGQGPLAFYQGFQIQVLINQDGRTFLDKSTERLPSGTSDTADWIDWIRIQDFNGDGFKDVVVDDAARNIVWLNDGAGNFQPK